MFLNRRMGVWRRRGEAASAGLSAAPHFTYYGLYSETVVSSIASAVALAEVGRFREAVQYLQKAAKALYEGAREVFERVRVSLQRLVELFVEAVTQVLAWVDEHKAYLFLMAVAAGAVALAAALNLWGLVELEKLAYAAVGAPFVVGRTETGGRAAERFRVVADRWRVDENVKQKIEEVINEVLNAPQKRERPFSKLTSLKNLPKPLVELRRAIARVKDEVERDAAVVAALVLYKTLVKNAETYGEWARWYKWARGLVEKQEFTVAAGDIEGLSEAHRRLEEVVEEVRRELNAVLTLYASHSPELYEKLRPHLEVDVKKAEELAKARSDELSKYSNANMGTKVYAALLSIARGGIYGHAAMLLMAEGALSDIVLSTPATMHWKAGNIAKMRGETVDPSYSRKEAKAGRIAGRRGEAMDLPHAKAADWGDRTASVLLRFLIGYGETDPQLLSGAGEVNFKFRLVEEGGKKDDEKERAKRGFQVFRVYGGVEAPVGELWIEKTVAYFTLSEEELMRLVEEAERTAPDLSGIRKIWQVLEWLDTDVSFAGGQIEGGTAHLWQLRWYLALFGGGRVSGGRAGITEEGIKPFVKMRWSREVLDRIIAEESKELEPLLGCAVNSWRELVDAINWSQVLERVEELADKLKPWIGPEEMDNTEREGLVRRMLGELALLTHFAEARRGMNDGDWREERAKRLARTVEALSGGRIVGDHAEELAELIIRYAESRAESVKDRIDKLAGELAGVFKEDVERVKGEVWGVVEFVLSDMYCLARDCARDEVVRKFVAPALELIMLDKALRAGFDRGESLLLFGEMYATAVAGDGTVGRRSVLLAVGGELSRGAALLRLAALHLLNQLLPKELKFGVRVYMGEGVYRMAATGEDAASFMRFLAVSAPSVGGRYLSPKFDDFVEAAKVEVRPGDVRPTKKGHVAADLIISEAGVAVKYSVYLSDKVKLKFTSSDRSRAELAARLLRLAGVNVDVRKEGGRDVWHVEATTDMLAAGREELRKALAEIVETARKSVGEEKAKRWLEKLGKGRVLKEGWPEYDMQLTRNGALVVRFGSTDRNSIEREKQRLENMGLEEGRHFTVKMPEGGKAGYVNILKEGLAHAAWLSVYGSERQRELAADFVKYILERAEKAGEEVSEKAREIIEEGMSRGSLKLEGFEKKVEVNGETYVVKVIGGEAVEEKQNGKKLLRIRITAEVGRVEGEHTIVDRVVREYTITFSRRGRNNAAVGFAVARADAPGGREADAERFSALVKALTGREPKVYQRSDGKIEIVCTRAHLEGFRRFAELADAIAKWLEETGR